MAAAGFGDVRGASTLGADGEAVVRTRAVNGADVELSTGLPIRSVVVAIVLIVGFGDFGTENFDKGTSGEAVPTTEVLICVELFSSVVGDAEREEVAEFDRFLALMKGSANKAETGTMPDFKVDLAVDVLFRVVDVTVERAFALSFSEIAEDLRRKVEEDEELGFEAVALFVAEERYREAIYRTIKYHSSRKTQVLAPKSREFSHRNRSKEPLGFPAFAAAASDFPSNGLAMADDGALEAAGEAVRT